MKKAILLYNAKAGRGTVRRNLRKIVDIFREAEYDMQAVPVNFYDNPFAGYEESDLVVVAGGDGTVNYVVNAMMRNNLSFALGILPSGTANDFAGALGMSNRVLRAARQIAHGEERLIDCGKIEQIENSECPPAYFVNIFSFGIFTTTSQHTPTHLKNIMGRAAYMIEGFKELKNIQAIPLTITSDDEALYYPTLMGLVFNGETAGRVPIARNSSLTDGLFDCIFLRKRDTAVESATDMLLYMSGVTTDAVKYLRTKQLTLVTPVDVATDIDGQSGGALPLRLTCLKGALRIVCPREDS